ncbi:MAG: transglycosylase domain-containing protein [Cyclobacteriaceae bacterium]|nr:transglycosylase domain-containing protein [Cyclobacteriaceae bacterium]
MTKNKNKSGTKNSQPISNYKKKIFRISVQLIFILTVSFSLFIISVRMGFYGKIPTIDELKSIRNMEASEVYSADGELLGKYYLQDRSAVLYQDISKNVINALVATEDARFFEHHGIDYRSLIRVIIKTAILQDRSGGGGSTLTQQLAKNIFGRAQYKHFSIPIIKIKEILIARRLEQAYSKEEIITLYLNTVPFGDNTYGIESAANRFFSTSSKQLSVPQAAVLVGMLKANYSYNPRLFPDKARFRRNVVINQMVKYDYLTKTEATGYKNELLALQYKKISHQEGIATYFREQVRQRALKWCAANTKPDGAMYNLYTDGLKIHTTIDARMQRHAENAMKTHMTDLQKTFDSHIKTKEPWRKNKNILKSAIHQSQRYLKLKEEGATEEEITAVFNTKYRMDIFTWQGEKEVQITPMDSIKHYLSFLNTGFMAVSPQTGQVKVWIGGINFKYFQYDHVNYTTKRQVGSTFKPIVYAAAIEKGIAPCDYISAEKTTYENFDNWTPSNGEDNYNMKFSMKGALTKSVNTVAVNLIDKTGINNIIQLANKMGVESELPSVPSLALGTANLSVSELATIYSTFVNHGTPIQPYTIMAIENKHGEIVYENGFRPKDQVLRQETCDMMIDMMKNVVNHGTASRIRWKYGLKNDIIGKTGTTQGNTDGWFAAATPNLVMISWVGADNPTYKFRTTNLGQGANTALPITALFLKSINSDDELITVSKARFPALSDSLAEQMDCLPEMDDATFMEKIFGKKDKVITKDFGDSLAKEKKNFGERFKRLFKKKKKN